MFAASLAMICLLAQNPRLAPHSSEARAKAQTLLKHGARHYQRAEFPEALDDFQRAYGIFASPKLLLNIGQASREVGRPVEALAAFEQFLEQAVDAPERALVEARQSIEELRAQVGALRIDCGLPGAEITVDGRKVGISPVKSPVHVMPGVHEVRATLAAAAPAVKHATVEAGAVETVVLHPVPELALAKGPRRGPASDGGAIASRAAKPTPPDGWTNGWMLGRTWTWVAAGSAVVLAGGAVAAGVIMQSKYQSLDQSCGRSAGSNYGGCSPDDVAALDAWKNTANVLWGLSAAAALTAGVLFYVEGQPVVVSPMSASTVGLQASMRY